MQSWMALLVAGMLIGPVVGSPVAYADTTEAETVVAQAYEQWNSNLGVRKTCSSGVSVIFEELSGRRGEYRTATGEVVIDPTDSADGMAAIVAHELSHHTFLACGVFADREFTEAFYAAQGLPFGRDWFDYSAGWTQTPAEHFAEAMATVIVGDGEGLAVGAWVGASVGGGTDVTVGATAVADCWVAELIRLATSSSNADRVAA